jgi:hypothetical protein
MDHLLWNGDEMQLGVRFYALHFSHNVIALVHRDGYLGVGT